MSSSCKISNKDLHREMFRYLSTTSAKPSLARVTAHVMDSIGCDEDDPNYKEFKDKIKSFYKYDFGADSIDEIKEQQLVNTIKNIYGEKPNKSEVVAAIKKSYYNDFDEESISQFYDMYFPRSAPAGGVRVMPITIPSPPVSPRARVEIDEDSIILIENAIKKRSATGLDFVTTDEIKQYLIMKEVPYSLTKQYTKEELINKIVKFKEGTLSPRSLRVQSSRTAGDDVKDFDVCNTNKYTKDQIMEYMKNMGIKLPLKYYTKQKLCQILQDNIGKQPAKKTRPIIIEEEEEEIVIKPKKKVVERKYEEEEEIVIPRKRKISIDELEELEEEAPEIPCGDYENYSGEDEFFACPEDQRCDVDRKKCLPKDYKLEEEFKNRYKAVTLDKNGTPVKFIGSPSKLKSLKQRFSDLKNQKQERRKKEEQEEEQRKFRKEQERLLELERKEQERLAEIERKAKEEEMRKFKKEQERLAEQERIRIQEEQERLREEQERLREEQLRLEEDQLKKKRYEEQMRIQEEQERLKKEQERIRQEQVELERQRRSEEKRQQAQKLREEQEQEMRRAEQERKAKEEEEKKSRRIDEEESYDYLYNSGNLTEEIPSDDIESLIADLEASNVQQRTFKDIREEIQRELRGEPSVVTEVPIPVIPAVPSKPAVVPSKPSKLIPRKIPIPSKKVEEVKEEVIEEEEDIEVEEPVQADIEEVHEVDFSEVRQRLKNIMLDPSVSRVLGGQDFLSIPKKISYCVGLSS